MTEKGRISRLEGGRAWISRAAAGCDPAEGCGGGCFGCHDPSALREYEALVPRALKLAPGDLVEVGSRGAGKAALVLFLMPLGVLVAAYAAAIAAGAESGVAAGAGIGGFAIGVAIALARKGRPLPADAPTVLRVLGQGREKPLH